MPDYRKLKFVACKKCGSYTAFDQDVLGTKITCDRCGTAFVAQEYVRSKAFDEPVSQKKPDAVPFVRVRIPVPAPRDQREQIAKMLLAMQYACDINCRNLFDSQGLGVENFDLDEIMDLEVGLVLKLTEQHIQHARDYATSKSGMHVVEYIESHIAVLNHVHSSAFAAAGHFFPVDDSLKNISDYILHFLRYRPDRGTVTLPEVMIPEMVNFITDIYSGNIEWQNGRKSRG